MKARKEIPPLVVAVHDICPEFEPQFQTWRTLLDRWGVRRRSLAVIPFYGGKTRVAQSKTLVLALAEEVRNGSEILLHGYTHVSSGAFTGLVDRARDRWTTQGCAEFALPGAGEGRRLIGKGLGELQPLVPKPIRGFIPPGWWLNSAIAAELPGMGLSFFTSTFGVHDLRRGVCLRTPVVVGLPQSRGVPAALLRGFCFRIIPALVRDRGILRIALHPYDLDNPRFMCDVEALIVAALKERPLAVYEDIIP